jgi:chemosensory pili system protein ChpA (sensor histidine kinase/response regulator)
MGYFIEEAKDHLNTIEQGLVNLQATIADSEMVHEVFRAAHSVKGGAAMLGLNSIQHTAHRLEDYFKVLKECPQVRVDQKLETLFLRVYDTLQDQVDHLQGPFGLTDDKAQEAMAVVEPVFAKLNQHLIALVNRAGGTPPEDVELTPISIAAPVPQPQVSQAVLAEESALRFIFQNDVPARLREMLQLFKQGESATTRQQLQELCRLLAQPGEQFHLANWCELLNTAQRAIASTDNSFRTLAPVVIKEVKRAQELFLADRLTEISVSEELLNLLPFEAWAEADLATDLTDLLGAVDLEGQDRAFESSGNLAIDSDSSGTGLGAEMAETSEADNWSTEGFSPSDPGNTVLQNGHEAELNFDLEFDQTASATAYSEPLDFDFTDHFDDEPLLAKMRERTGPEVGAAELNSLADLFEGELPDLGLTWQEETDMSLPVSEQTASLPDNSGDFSGDFFDLLDQVDQDNSDELALEEALEDDLSGLLNAAALQANHQAQTDPNQTAPAALSLQPTANADPIGNELNHGLNHDLPPDSELSEPTAPDEMAMFFFAEEQPDQTITISSNGKAEHPSGFQNLDALFAGVEAVEEFAAESFAVPELSDAEYAQDGEHAQISPVTIEAEFDADHSSPPSLGGGLEDLFTSEPEQIADSALADLDSAELESFSHCLLDDSVPEIDSATQSSATQSSATQSIALSGSEMDDLFAAGLEESEMAAAIATEQSGLFLEAIEIAGTTQNILPESRLEELENDELIEQSNKSIDELLEQTNESNEVVDRPVNEPVDELVELLDELPLTELTPVEFDLDAFLAEESSEAAELLELEQFSTALEAMPVSDINLRQIDEIEDTGTTNAEADFHTVLSENLVPEISVETLAEPSDDESIEPDDPLTEASTIDALASEDFADLELMLTENSSSEINSELVTTTASLDEDFADLEVMLGEEFSLSIATTDLAQTNSIETEAVDEAEITEIDDFAALEDLLDDESPGSSTLDADTSEKTKSRTDDEFGDLEALLQDTDQKLGVGSSPVRNATNTTSRRSTRRNAIADQTMRVSVKHLDNLNNLVGEMVVNRNSLEQTQERMRQFLDNLLYQVQQLSDVGQRMRDLYERSLLESSLLASRRSYQLSGSSSHSVETSHATGASFDALEMDKFTGFHTLSQEMIELIVRVRESASDIDFVVEESDQVTRNFRQITTQLQEGLTRSRMVPFAQTADRLPRGVRDNAIKYGKKAELHIEGRDTLIDKMIVEQLYDPMTHLVNNAIAHGIEPPQERIAAGKPATGRIIVRAFHQGNQTVISVSDDGAGIDIDAVKAKAVAKRLITVEDAAQMSRLEAYDLLFHHGFSTADQVDDLRGRGVGLDVVRNNLSEIRGVISIDSAIGKGSMFTIRLPLTLSISKALCCISHRARIAFPMDGVEDMLDVPKDRIYTDEQGQSCIQWRDALLPFQPLADLLKYNRVLGRGSVYGGNQEDDMLSIVVLRSAGNYLALQVDQVLGEQEIVIKQLEGPVPKPIGVAGATVLGDGRIMPIADVLELIDLSQGRIRRETGSALWDINGDQLAQDTATLKTDPTVLIVDDSITVRELLSMTFNKVGYRVEQARDGQEAWEKLRSGLPCDLVFCDIEMPRMDGLELLSRLQKDPHLSHLPIAMLTSRGADRHRQMAVQLGAKGYFTKPYLEEMLLDAAQRMLKGEVLVTSAAG